MSAEFDSISLDAMPACVPGPDGSCSICGDEGVPAEVLALKPDDMALVALPDGEREVAVDLIEDVEVGDLLLVHLGFAIAKVD